MTKKILALALLFPMAALAQDAPGKTVPALASLSLLQKLGIPTLASDPITNVAYARLTPIQQEKILLANHADGKCAGFEALPESNISLLSVGSKLTALRKNVTHDRAWASRKHIKSLGLEKRPEITAALLELKEDNLRSNIAWMSAYPNRDHRKKNPNAHVIELENRMKAMLKNYRDPATVEQITHLRTHQNSLRVHLEGKTKPSEIIILGAHFDSINWNGDTNDAPGSDDNASGSSNLIEALRVLIQKGRPERSIEFFWYAAEETGLVGSAEIADHYKQDKKDVVAVLQLDMTLFPGAGEQVVGSMTDFTSTWLREYLVALNEAYIGIHLIEDECGYGCSDHASWYRQDYPTVIPFEADMNTMNHKLHTSQDVVGKDSSFSHSLVFSKIALALAMDLGNSSTRQPY